MKTNAFILFILKHATQSACVAFLKECQDYISENLRFSIKSWMDYFPLGNANSLHLKA